MDTKDVTFGIAAKGVVLKGENYLVLKKSHEEDVNPGTYDFPGGRLEFGEKLEDTLTREIQEETGLSVEIISVFNTWTFTKDKFQLVGADFLCKADKSDVKTSSEHTDNFWMSAKEILDSQDIPDWMKTTIAKAEDFRQKLSVELQK